MHCIPTVIYASDDSGNARDGVCSKVVLGVLRHIQTSVKSCTVSAIFIPSDPVAIATACAWLTTAYGVLVYIIQLRRQLKAAETSKLKA